MVGSYDLGLQQAPDCPFCPSGFPVPCHLLDEDFCGGRGLLYARILTVGGESVCSPESIESSVNILDLQRSTVRGCPLEAATFKSGLACGDCPGAIWS